MASSESDHGAQRICSLAELHVAGCRTVSIAGRTLVVFEHAGRVFAVDNRCPHMGFPLNRGTVKDGILTCHWHHAKFDLASGCTFDPFADDVQTFSASVLDGEVWVDPRPQLEDARPHWLRKLDDGLEQNLRLLLAKAVIALGEEDEWRTVAKRAALFGVRNRAEGWSTGLSILAAMVNVRPVLAPDDRQRALYQGLVHVARNTEDHAPNFDLEALAIAERSPGTYRAWFRQFVETRSTAPAERCLRTAIVAGLGPTAVSDLLFAACTDHLFLDTGHTLDFANKACELLDHIGWEHAGEILGALVPHLVQAQRMEETAAWRHPVDLPALIHWAADEFAEAVHTGGGRLADWDGHRSLAETILDDDPATALRAIVAAAREGVPLTDLSATVAYAAARRAAHFHISNEFGDWDTVHHCFTYANAVDQALRRAPSPELARGILDGAMAVYLERFLNVPRQPLPQPSGRTASTAALRDAFDRQQQVDAAADLVANLLADGQRDAVLPVLGHVLLREDAGFHAFQIYEAAVRQAVNFAGRPEADDILVGAARFLAAHSPTPRATVQTFEIALRLHRGEALHTVAKYA